MSSCREREMTYRRLEALRQAHDGTDGAQEGDRAATLAAIERTASMLCKRWKPSIIYLLARQPQRYNALARLLPNVTAKMLTQQLRALERDGLVHRSARAGGRRHVEYALTPLGHELRPAVETFATWSRERSIQ